MVITDINALLIWLIDGNNWYQCIIDMTDWWSFDITLFSALEQRVILNEWLS